MVEAVFSECRRVLEPGGRICVNVAGLGRRPYRSLPAEMWAVFARLGLLARGEIVWVKARGASGSAAFGSFAQASNPLLRDVSERILIASKGRYGRATHPKTRRTRGLPWESTIFLMTIRDAGEVLGLSLSRVYELIGRGELEVRPRRPQRPRPCPGSPLIHRAAPRS